jgi:hypothetical protein
MQEFCSVGTRKRDTGMTGDRATEDLEIKPQISEIKAPTLKHFELTFY